MKTAIFSARIFSAPAKASEKAHTKKWSLFEAVNNALALNIVCQKQALGLVIGF